MAGKAVMARRGGRNKLEYRGGGGVKARSRAVSTKRTILSPFTKEYRVLAANSGIRLFLEGSFPIKGWYPIVRSLNFVKGFFLSSTSGLPCMGRSLTAKILK
ncbi:hypothetical protein HYC85_009433 [Camellia sinensis]|uniref:Uncharacterized protein n=1 Tax=Camellia sinensis TaxID=4442 RepID=A0A7J7HFL4_CAMSI|nr:hypothetical protein HYC85_009433 [Camellia sinensis]